MKKENRIIAEKIVFLESIIQSSFSSKEDKDKAKKQIIALSDSISSLEDFMEIDEIIFSKIKNNF